MCGSPMFPPSVATGPGGGTGEVDIVDVVSAELLSEHDDAVQLLHLRGVEPGVGRQELRKEFTGLLW